MTSYKDTDLDHHRIKKLFIIVIIYLWICDVIFNEWNIMVILLWKKEHA